MSSKVFEPWLYWVVAKLIDKEVAVAKLVEAKISTVQEAKKIL